jgi:hypothetical protein
MRSGVAVAGGPWDSPSHLFQVKAATEAITEGAEIAFSILLKT